MKSLLKTDDVTNPVALRERALHRAARSLPILLGFQSANLADVPFATIQ